MKMIQIMVPAREDIDTEGLKRVIGAFLNDADVEVGTVERANLGDIHLAREAFSDEFTEFDNDALVSRGDGGTWVQGWLLVKDTEENEEEGSELPQDVRCNDDVTGGWG